MSIMPHKGVSAARLIEGVGSGLAPGSDPIVCRWLSDALSRLHAAQETNNPAVIKAAGEALWELWNAVGEADWWRWEGRA